MMHSAEFRQAYVSVVASGDQIFGCRTGLKHFGHIA
jgi:hypothetical protein